MKVSRRDFLKYCGMTATVLGLSAHDLLGLKEALANPNGPTVLWLQGAGCTGCSISFLNRISTAAPKTAGDLLVNSINLAYHPNLSSLAGDAVVDVINQAYTKGNYVLIVEGAVPTAFNGAACFAWSYKGVDKTFKDAVTMLASKAAKIVSVGSCAAFGGIPVAQRFTTRAGIKSWNPAGGDLAYGGRVGWTLPLPDAYGRGLDIGVSAVFEACFAGRARDVLGRAEHTPWWLVVAGATWRSPEGPGSDVADRGERLSRHTDSIVGRALFVPASLESFHP